MYIRLHMVPIYYSVLLQYAKKVLVSVYDVYWGPLEIDKNSTFV